MKSFLTYFFPHLLMFKITGQEQMWDVCKNMRIYRESFNNFKLAKRIALNLKLTCCGYVRTKPIFVLCASFSFTHSLSLSLSLILFSICFLLHSLRCLPFVLFLPLAVLYGFSFTISTLPGFPLFGFHSEIYFIEGALHFGLAYATEEKVGLN